VICSARRLPKSEQLALRRVPGRPHRDRRVLRRRINVQRTWTQPPRSAPPARSPGGR
jgi:hypothetical protein